MRERSALSNRLEVLCALIDCLGRSLAAWNKREESCMCLSLHSAQLHVLERAIAARVCSEPSLRERAITACDHEVRTHPHVLQPFQPNLAVAVVAALAAWRRASKTL